jgi:hypothetical protein
MSSVFPPLVKGGEGGFVDGRIIKSPLIPLFQREEYIRVKKDYSIPVCFSLAITEIPEGSSAARK